MDLIGAEELTERLSALEGWRGAPDGLKRDYRFDSFVEAFGFMSAVALVAESLNHHPEWSNCYGRVSLLLVTHECRGVTERDFRLAHRVEELARRWIGSGAAAGPEPMGNTAEHDAAGDHQ